MSNICLEFPEGQFTSISNNIVRDEILSLEAKGLFLWLSSHNSNSSFVLNKIDIMKRNNIGEVKYLRIMNELKNSGYLKIEKYSNEKGQFSYKWILRHNPDMNNPDIDKQGVDNHPPISNTKYKKTNIRNTNINIYVETKKHFEILRENEIKLANNRVSEKKYIEIVDLWTDICSKGKVSKETLSELKDIDIEYFKDMVKKFKNGDSPNYAMLGTFLKNGIIGGGIDNWKINKKNASFL